MSTPLVYAANQLLQEITDRFYFPHIIYFSPTTRRWRARSWASWKLIPFYFSNIILTFGFLYICCLIQAFKYLCGVKSRVPTTTLLLQIGVMVASSYGWTLNFLSFRNAGRMVGYMNAVVKFEEDLLQTSVVNKKPNNKLLKSIIQMLQNELMLLLNGRNPDFLGMFQVSFVIYSVLMVFLLAPVGIFFNFDPMFFLLKDLGFGDENTQGIWLASTRLFIGWAVAAETFRTLCLIVNPLLLEHCIYNKVVSILRQYSVNYRVVCLYRQLCVINYGGNDLTACAFAVTMRSAFGLAVMLTCFVLVGWKFFPLPLYLCGIPTTFVVHFAIYIVLPLMANGHQQSLKMIRNEWPTLFLKNMWSLKSKREIRRILLALRPISFKTLLTREEVDKNFRRQYTANIMGRTMDLLLLSGVRL